MENMTGPLFLVEVANDANVAELKREVESQEKLPSDRLIFILDANPNRLIDDHDDGSGALLVDFGVQDWSHIYIFFLPIDDCSPHLSVFSFPDNLLESPSEFSSNTKKVTIL